MKQVALNVSPNDALQRVTNFLQEKGFTIFAEIDHQANAAQVELEMPASYTLIFGNPLAGTKLMQKDINISLDLPLKLAIVEQEGQTFLLYQTTADYTDRYQVEGHPVLDNIEKLFASLVLELKPS